MRREDEVRLRHMLDAAREVVGLRGAPARTWTMTGCWYSPWSRISRSWGKRPARCLKPHGINQLQSLPWADVIGMRHRLVHAYFDINLDILWRTVQGDIPALITVLEPLVSEDESSAGTDEL